MKLKAFVDWLLCREKLRARNDYLVNANRRLGLQILELRSKQLKPRKTNGALKSLTQQVESLKVKLYTRHIEAQRQSLLVKAFKQHVEPETFEALCKQFSSLTDEQIEAMK